MTDVVQVSQACGTRCQRWSCFVLGNFDGDLGALERSGVVRIEFQVRRQPACVELDIDAWLNLNRLARCAGRVAHHQVTNGEWFTRQLPRVNLAIDAPQSAGTVDRRQPQGVCSRLDEESSDVLQNPVALSIDRCSRPALDGVGHHSPLAIENGEADAELRRPFLALFDLCARSTLTFDVSAS